MDDVENSIQGLFEVVRDRKHHYLRVFPLFGLRDHCRLRHL
jgi:hypothetical protein